MPSAGERVPLWSQGSGEGRQEFRENRKEESEEESARLTLGQTGRPAERQELASGATLQEGRKPGTRNLLAGEGPAGAGRGSPHWTLRCREARVGPREGLQTRDSPKPSLIILRGTSTL